MSNYLQIDEQILEIDKTICDYIDVFKDDTKRGLLSKSILAQLRNFLEHIMLKVYANGADIENSYENICEALRYMKSCGDLKVFARFHNFLEIVASHYTLDEEKSERLMLKYYMFLFKIKDFLKTKYSFDVLMNLDKFPLNTDIELQEYYKKIAEKINLYTSLKIKHSKNDRFYIQKIKPFFDDGKIFYEVTFTPANEKASKFDRIIAFTELDISSYYAAKLFLIEDSIQILGKTMPIRIIIDWEVSIRPCEINNFSSVLGVNTNVQTKNSEYRNLMQYLTQTELTLVDLLDFPDFQFQNVKQQITSQTTSVHFFEVLEKCRNLIKFNRAGSNILRYLLLHLNNKVIKNQNGSSNDSLSNLHLSYSCIPFDQMPFSSSLIGHNPKLSDLFDCFESHDRQHEILARYVKNNTEIRGQLYTPTKDLENVSNHIKTYNDFLYHKHTGRKLAINNDHIYIKDYQDDTIFIVKKLIDLAKTGVKNYNNYVQSWLDSSAYNIDCKEKREVLIQMFKNSKVALIYGPAGTGKSTLINHISNLFAKNSKLYLANTNPAVDNLKRRVTTSNCDFSTIAKFMKKSNIKTDYDLLFIDECSMVSNRDMRAILEKATFKLIVLVGDIYQIEAIRFGNWFSVMRSFIPSTSIFELTTPYRSRNDALLKLWTKVRKMDDTVLEHIAKKGYSVKLDASIFSPLETDEIILCLNYDGLYGINNINRFLQQANHNQSFEWGVQTYKVGDPILFNESERFAPLIYNNMKGRIVNIQIQNDQIRFDIELDKVVTEIDAAAYNFDLLESPSEGSSIISFLVDKYKSTDDDDDFVSTAIVPFQVAYAVSIHKAQGLEYNSVKIVITDEVDELITHNIFYTAITRAREKLKIYWTPEVEHKVLNTIKPKFNNKDVALLREKLS